MGVPAALVKRPSVAPVDMAGTRGIPGHILADTFSIGATIVLVRGGGGETGLGTPTGVTLILSSAKTLISCPRTDSMDSPGRIRQFTLA